MTEENLRDATQEEEILQIIEEISTQKLEVMAWQSQSEKRVVEQVIFKSLDKRNKLIEIGLTDKSKTFEFTEDSEVFFREESKKLLFRAKISITSKKLIEGHVPSELKLKDRREFKREIYKVGPEESSGMDVSFSSYSKVNQSNQHFDAELFDISNHGCAIKLRKQMIKHFKEGDVIKLEVVKGKEVNPPVEGEVVYLKSYEDAKRLHVSVFHRLGVKFNEKAEFIGD